MALRIVIAYNDIAAGKRAMEMLGRLANRFGGGIEFQPIPWSFDLLMDDDWRDVAAGDAVRADILVVATSDYAPLPAGVSEWLESAIDHRRGATTALVALFGPPGHSDEPGSPRLAPLEKAAREAGLDFFAPESRGEGAADADSFARVAGLPAPLRMESPGYCQPAPRWGINE